MMNPPEQYEGQNRAEIAAHAYQIAAEFGGAQCHNARLLGGRWYAVVSIPGAPGHFAQIAFGTPVPSVAEVVAATAPGHPGNAGGEDSRRWSVGNYSLHGYIASPGDVCPTA